MLNIGGSRRGSSIDARSYLKPLDPTRYALRFSPRRKTSNWANSNRARALQMLREGKMTPAGLAVLPLEIIRAWEEENQREDKSL